MGKFAPGLLVARRHIALPGLGLCLGKRASSSQDAFCQADHRKPSPPEKGCFRSLSGAGCVREPGRASWRGPGKAFQGQCCPQRGPQGPGRG